MDEVSLSHRLNHIEAILSGGQADLDYVVERLDYVESGVTKNKSWLGELDLLVAQGSREASHQWSSLAQGIDRLSSDGDAMASRLDDMVRCIASLAMRVSELEGMVRRSKGQASEASL